MSSGRWRSEEDVIRSLDCLSEMTEVDVNLKPLRIESEREVERRERKMRRRQVQMDIEKSWNQVPKGAGRGHVIRSREEENLSRKDINERQLQRQLRESLGVGFSNEVIEKHFGQCNEEDELADVKQDWSADYSCFSSVEESGDSGGSESTSCEESGGCTSSGGEQRTEIAEAGVSPSPSPAKQLVPVRITHNTESCGIYVPPPMRKRAQQNASFYSNACAVKDKAGVQDIKKKTVSGEKMVMANDMARRIVAVHDAPKLADFLTANNSIIYGPGTKVWTPCDLPGNVNRLAKLQPRRADGSREVTVDVSSCAEKCEQSELRLPLPEMTAEFVESIAESRELFVSPPRFVSPCPRISFPLHVLSSPPSGLSSPSPEFSSPPPRSSSSLPHQRYRPAETTITPFAGRDFYSLNAKIIGMNKYGYRQIRNEPVYKFDYFPMSKNNHKNSFHMTPEEFPAL